MLFTILSTLVVLAAATYIVVTLVRVYRREMAYARHVLHTGLNPYMDEGADRPFDAVTEAMGGNDG